MSCLMILADGDSAQKQRAREVLAAQFPGCAIIVDDSREALQRLRIGVPPDVVMIDHKGAEAGKLTHDIRTCQPQLPIIVLVAYGEELYARQALAAGASDFLIKPVMPERLRLSIEQALQMHRMRRYLARLERHIGGHVDFSDIIGQSPALRQAIMRAQEAAASRAPVWIEGEPGTGKGLLARAIHGGSDRAGNAFVTVHCRMLPEDTAEEWLLGREQAGAHVMRGTLREAQHGTLLIKNIEALRPALRQKLLDAVQPGRMTPGGAPVDVRLIIAGKKPDQPWPLSIAMPPLRDRRQDVPLLAKHFTAMHAVMENRPAADVSEQALHYLSALSWPGHVRELSQLLWRAVLLCDQEVLDAGDICLIQQLQPAYAVQREHMLGADALLFDTQGRIRKLRSIEDEVIRNALRLSGGCMSRAARTLGIGRSTLYRRVNELRSGEKYAEAR